MGVCDHGTSDAGKHAPSRGMAVMICQHCIIHVPMQSQMHKRITEAALSNRPGIIQIQLELLGCWSCWSCKSCKSCKS